MMPLLITLVTALLNGIEHSDKQWKHLFRAACAALCGVLREVDRGPGLNFDEHACAGSGYRNRGCGSAMYLRA